MKRALVQGNPHAKRPAGTIDWAEHEEAWLGYQRKYPGSARQQDAQRIHDRGGFGYEEVTEFLGHEPKTWLPRK